MTNQEILMEQIRTWSLNYDFIKQIHLMPLTENVVDLVFELNPVPGDDTDIVTWYNTEHKIRESLEILLKTKRIKLRLRNASMYSNINKDVDDNGKPIL